jgi:serine/threonine-protein kinase
MGVSLGRSADELRRHIADRSSQLLAALSMVARQDLSLEELPVGFEVDHRYRVVRLLGVGAMGAVYEVTRVEDGARFAMKVAVGIAGVALARLAREAHLLSHIDSEHVVKVIDIDVGERGFIYMVLELVEGDTLRQLLQNRHPLPRAVVVDILLQVALGMAALHRASIAHRDLKPENVLVDDGEGLRRVKITDFGISRLTERVVTEVVAEADADLSRDSADALDAYEGKTIEAVHTASFRSARSTPQHRPHVGPALSTGAELTAAGAIAGTPDYIAPELLRGTSTHPLSADIFSFGVVAYELVMNHRPYHFSMKAPLSDDELRQLARPPELRNDCAALQALVMRCLAFESEQRPHIDEIVAQLRSLSEAQR